MASVAQQIWGLGKNVYNTLGEVQASVTGQIKDNTSNQVKDSDPLAFRTISYPRDITNNMANGHYMLFYVNVQNRTSFEYQHGYTGAGVGGVRQIKVNKRVGPDERTELVDTSGMSTGKKVYYQNRAKNLKLSIDEEVKAYEKVGDGIGYGLTTRLKHQIVSIDGDTKRASINSFVDNEFLSRDSMAFRTYVNEIMPDVDMTSTYVDSDGIEKEFTVPMTVTFLWPSARV